MAIQVGDIVLYHLEVGQGLGRTGWTPHADTATAKDGQPLPSAVKDFAAGRICPMLVCAVYPDGLMVDGHVFLGTDPLPLLVQGIDSGTLPGQWTVK